MDKLKPCPFCGSEAIYRVRNYGYLDDTAAVFCNSCKAIMFTEENDQEGVNDKTEKIAADAWNKRCDSTPCWIPCSERLPDYNVPVLTWDGATYQVEKRIPCIIDDDAEPIFSEWWVSDEYDEDESLYYPNLRDGAAIAWMPLPEPYEPPKGET